MLAALGAAPLAAQAPVRLSFADAVRRAAGEAPTVALATLRTDEADAQVRQARSALLPSLSVAGVWVNRDFNSQSLGIPFPPAFSLPNPVPPFNNYDGRVTVTQTLFDWSNVTRVRAASARADGSRAERGVTVETAAQAAAVAYLRASRAQAVVAARQADSSIAAELVTLAEAQKAAGVSAAIDVTRARTQLVRAEGLLIVARNERDRGRIVLARTLGIDPATPLELADTLAGTLGAADLPAGRDAVLTVALAGRPDLGAELARATAARRTGTAIRAERLPRVGVEADYGLNGMTVPSALSTRQVALEVTIPILDGFRREARLSEQDAVVRESEVRERDLRQQITADVDAALLDLRSAEAQQLIAADQLRLAEDELSQSRQRFKAGVAGNIEVIDAQSNLIRARDTDIDARFAAASARVALARAAGVARTAH
ncbi:MAG: hypothetical protein AUH07_02660 [Gemmatimonadetes bacterium 13_2_20CM_70_9]|nr:MAG: hypothetical protein AUH07_02660 [Gemmatimonadetes bacterium 13_2_20CM_70_9]